MFDAHGAHQRKEHQVGTENSKEGAAQRQADRRTEGRRTAADLAHGDDHAQHAGADTDGGQGVTDVLQRFGHQMPLGLGRFEVHLHHVRQIHRFDAARDNDLHGIAEERRGMTVEKSMILSKNRTLVWMFEMFFYAQQTIAASDIKELIQVGQQIEVVLFRVVSVQQVHDRWHGLLDNTHTIGGHIDTDSPTKDGDELGPSCHEHHHRATVQQVAREDAANSEDQADKGNHKLPSIPQFLGVCRS